MKRITLGIGMTVGAASLAAGALILAPTASAVDPTTATIQADCGSFGKGTVKLEATQDGTAATITVSTEDVKAPIDVAAGAATTTLTLTKNGSDTATFTGKDNPAIKAGAGLNSGPLKGTVAAGDKLEGKSAKISVFGITANCNATSAQDPGPFTF